MLATSNPSCGWPQHCSARGKERCLQELVQLPHMSGSSDHPSEGRTALNELNHLHPPSKAPLFLKSITGTRSNCTVTG